MGTDAAIEAADVVIMNDDVTKILTAIKISEKDTENCGTEYSIFTCCQVFGFRLVCLWFNNYVVGSIC